MTDVVECWNWLLSACPRQELVFLQEMISAWHHTRAARLGLFQPYTEEAGDPLAPTEVSI
jgi:PI4-kinase N-terminal region